MENIKRGKLKLKRGNLAKVTASTKRYKKIKKESDRSVAEKYVSVPSPTNTPFIICIVFTLGKKLIAMIMKSNTKR